MSPRDPINVSLCEVDDLDSLAVLWADLEARGDCSFFNSWSWIGTWLEGLPAEMRPQLLLAEGPAGVLGLGLLGSRQLRRGGVIHSQALLLNETGDPRFDELTIEHNGLLTDRTVSREVCRACLEALYFEFPNWDELYLSGLDEGNPLECETNEFLGLTRQLVVKERPCYYVDLADLRETGGDYVDRLGTSSRTHTRKSMRLYEKLGPLEFTVAGDLPQALQFYEELKQLHAKQWRDRGQPGAFALPEVDDFHRRLIARCQPQGEIQLARITAGAHVIGYLYNLVYRGAALSYQSGFDYPQDAKLKPGLLSHVLAVEHNRQAPEMRIYDLLAGDQRYKESLAYGSTNMRWLVLQRQRSKFRIEGVLRSVRRNLKSLRRSIPSVWW